MNNFKKLGLFLTLFLAVALSIIWGISELNKNDKKQATGSFYNVSQVLGGIDTTGFKKALKPRTFKFPRDYGPHPAYKNEWWYFTGNLNTKNGRHFGYEFTLFRIGLKPGKSTKKSGWAANEFYMANLALTDVRNGKFYDYADYSRPSVGLAGAQANPFKIWIDNWSVKANGSNNKLLSMKAKHNGIALNFNLKELLPPVLEGNHGLSQKGSKPGNASYYFSIPRLSTQGSIRIGKKTFHVHGLSWMDREWGTSMLEKGIAGWDWFALQLNNGWDIMYYQLRKDDGLPASTSQGSLIKPAGNKIVIPFRSLKIKVTKHWTSPDGIRYPSGWKLSFPSHKIELKITPYIPNQELRVSVRYWEGAVKISGMMNGKRVSGNGYVELTGYGNKMSGTGVK